MGKSAPIWGSLSDVRVIMTIMRILTVKSLCQAAMGWVLVLECLLLDTHGCLWLCPITLGFKWCYFSRTRLRRLYLIPKRPLGIIAGGPSACQAGLRGGAIVGGQVVKSCSSVVTEIRERTIEEACKSDSGSRHNSEPQPQY
jgi:hypothetical protein